MNTCDTEILVGHISDLPTTKKSKSNLGLLFIQEYFLLEVCLKEDVLGCHHDLGIEDVKIRVIIPITRSRRLQVVNGVSLFNFSHSGRCITGMTRT